MKNWFDKFEEIPQNPIMAENAEFIKDKRPEKVNAGIGMIMDEKTGKAYVLKIIAKIFRISG